jgi:hypothetical protein
MMRQKGYLEEGDTGWLVWDGSDLESEYLAN